MAWWDFEPEKWDRPGAVKDAPIGAVKRTLASEHLLEMFEKREGSATISGPEIPLDHWQISRSVTSDPSAL